ncbi:MAG: RNA polymerase sigma-70 factor [Parafilimonas sp.]
METLNLNTIQHTLSLNDENALAELYHYYYKRLIQFAKSIVRTNELAEEIVEDVFIKLWRNRVSICNIKNLNVYLYIAVKNTSLNTLSQKARQLVSAPFDFLNIELENELDNPDDLMITAEMMQKMYRVIDSLPPRCKMIFKLVREDGLKYKEVAEILNISVNTIDAQIAIAVKKICTALEIKKPSKKISASITEK